MEVTHNHHRLLLWFLVLVYGECKVASRGSSDMLNWHCSLNDFTGTSLCQAHILKSGGKSKAEVMEEVKKFGPIDNAEFDKAREEWCAMGDGQSNDDFCRPRDKRDKRVEPSQSNKDQDHFSHIKSMVQSWCISHSKDKLCPEFLDLFIKADKERLESNHLEHMGKQRPVRVKNDSDEAKVILKFATMMREPSSPVHDMMEEWCIGDNESIHLCKKWRFHAHDHKADL
jgi:hypothetical protein